MAGQGPVVPARPRRLRVNADTVRITHPRYPEVSTVVSRGAYERRSRRLGWQLADDASPEVTEVSEPTRQEQVTPDKAELLERARALGIEGVDGRTGLRKLREAIANHEATE